MKLAANISLRHQQLPLLERIAAAARDGFEGVEVLFPYDINPQALRSALGDAGLQRALINTQFGAGGEPGFAAVRGAEAQFRDALHRALDVASATGCPRLHVMAGKPAPVRISAIVDACFRLIVDGESAWPWRRLGGAQELF